MLQLESIEFDEGVAATESLCCGTACRDVVLDLVDVLDGIEKEYVVVHASLRWSYMRDSRSKTPVAG